MSAPVRPKLQAQRKRTNSLGGELRGDTSATAISTLHPTSPSSTSPPSPLIPPAKGFPRSKRRKVRSLFRRWKDFSFRHTWVNPLVIMLVVLSAYAVNPTPSNPLHHAIFLSYAVPPHDPSIPAHAQLQANPPQHYGKGLHDLSFVAFYIVVLSFTREFLMQRAIRPFAIWNGIRSRSKQNRFLEQAYTALYFAVFGPYGLYVMSRTPVWYFNTKGMYEDFPHHTHEAVFKAYYLLQAAYWAQQAIVLCLQLEKPRKDFKELAGHHVVTLALIGLSYRFHFTYIGVAVYITHDISDFFLAVSKVFNYLDSPATVPWFATFIVIWIYLRHYVNLVILYSVLTSFKTVGPFDLNWVTQQYKCWISQYITFSLLAILQCINLFWLFFILRVALNIAFRSDSHDVRSSDEENEVEDEAGEDLAALKSDPPRRKGAGSVNKANGNAQEEHSSYADAVKEGKKEV